MKQHLVPYTRVDVAAVERKATAALAVVVAHFLLLPIGQVRQGPALPDGHQADDEADDEPDGHGGGSPCREVPDGQHSGPGTGEGRQRVDLAPQHDRGRC